MGYWSYGELRNYGVPKRAPKPRQIFTGKERDSIIQQTSRMFDDWESSPFEMEGNAVAAIRSNLCLSGHQWLRADYEARALINEVLVRKGAQRPSWEQGQREYAIESGRCIWCYSDIEPDEWGTNSKFCSSNCAQRMKIERAETWNLRTNSVARDALRIIRRESLPVIECVSCGTEFKPQNMDNRGRQYCSPRCAVTHHRPRQTKECDACGVNFPIGYSGQKYCSNKCKSHMLRKFHPRECAHCGTLFRPKKSDSRCCSQQCASAQKVTPKHFCTCAWCGVPFMGKHVTSKFCSSAHKSMDYQQRTGRKNLRRPADNIIYLTPAIFDGWFQRAA